MGIEDAHVSCDQSDVMKRVLFVVSSAGGRDLRHACKHISLNLAHGNHEPGGKTQT